MQRCIAPREPWRNAMCLNQSPVSIRAGTGVSASVFLAELPIAVPPGAGLSSYHTAGESSSSFCCHQTSFITWGRHVARNPETFHVTLNKVSLIFVTFTSFLLHDNHSLQLQFNKTIQFYYIVDFITWVRIFYLTPRESRSPEPDTSDLQGSLMSVNFKEAILSMNIYRTLEIWQEGRASKYTTLFSKHCSC